MSKILTFFNEKGGTGKTTLTALFASWLAYAKREKVYVYDLDFPMYQMYNLRETDKMILKEVPDSELARCCMDNSNFFYPIGKAAAKEAFTERELENIASSIAAVSARAGDSYILLDFPGRYLPSDPVHYLSRKGMIDLVVFPIDSDRQSKASALNTFSLMQRAYERPGGKQEGVFLWNRESQKERVGRKDWYSDSDKLFEQLGIPVVKGRIRDIIIARRDASTYGFIRNTLCWPEKNVRTKCPYIEQIFEEIKSRADGTWSEEKSRQTYGY